MSHRHSPEPTARTRGCGCGRGFLRPPTPPTLLHQLYPGSGHHLAAATPKRPKPDTHRPNIHPRSHAHRIRQEKNPYTSLHPREAAHTQLHAHPATYTHLRPPPPFLTRLHSHPVIHTNIHPRATLHTHLHALQSLSAHTYFKQVPTPPILPHLLPILGRGESGSTHAAAHGSSRP